MIINEEERNQFFVKITEYWNTKGLTGVKVPQIGGKELDFFKLYKSVCMRGGAQQVSNNKLWKDIVNEFGFPPTCTSASFTLRNHYSKYLLGFEQKDFLGKEDDNNLPELVAGRIRKLPPKGSNPTNKENQGENQSEDEEESSSSVEEQKSKEKKEKVVPVNVVNVAASALGQQLNQQYQKQEKKEIYYIKKTKMFHHKSDLKRISLAFQTRISDEVTYALNSLILYSINQTDPFVFDSSNQLLENITRYLEESIKNVPSMYAITSLKQIVPKQNNNQSGSQSVSQVQNLNNLQQNYNNSSYNYISNKAQLQMQQQQYESECETIHLDRETTDLIKTLNILENYNFKVSDILIFQQKKGVEISPIELLKKRKKEYINQVYDVVAEINLIEQIRTIFQIIRNLSYTKANEQAIAREERLSLLILQLFIHNCDSDITKSAIDIISNISKHIQIPLIPDSEKFCERLFSSLQSDNNDEIESAVDTLRNLITIPENEHILEKMLPFYKDSLNKLLIQTQADIREGVMEFLCFLSDLKMSTKLTLAQQPKLIMRLVSLLASGAGKVNQKITKLAALTLNNISMAPSSRKYLLPYEKDLFIVASTDDTVSKLLGDILSELNDFEVENHIF